MLQENQHGAIGMNIFIYDFVPLTNSTEDITATQRAKAFYTGWYVIIFLTFYLYEAYICLVYGSSASVKRNSTKAAKQ
jgi:hypothetical protein